MCNVSRYLFRSVYNHPLEKYRNIPGAKQLKFLKRFKDVFAVDGGAISLCKKMESVFKSIHKNKSSL